MCRSARRWPPPPRPAPQPQRSGPPAPLMSPPHPQVSVDQAALGPACRPAAAACPEAGPITGFAPGRGPKQALVRLPPQVVQEWLGHLGPGEAPDKLLRSEAGRRELFSRGQSGEAGRKMKVVTGDLASSLVVLGHRSETKKEMRLELHRVPSSSVVELGLEPSPFSFYPQGRPPLDLVCSLWPSPPTKDE